MYLLVATPSHQTAKKSNLDKRKPPDKSPDVIAKNAVNDIGDTLLNELEKILLNISSIPDIHVQSFIQFILARCLPKSSENIVKISATEHYNYVDTFTYMKMPQRVVACNPVLSK